MAKIDQVKGLPKWFKLDNYKGAKQFDKASDWLERLRIRKHILDFLLAFDDRTTDDPVAMRAYMLKLLEGANAELKALRAAPLDLDSGSSWASIAGDYSIAPYPSPVRSLTFPDLVNQYRQDYQEVENGDCAEGQVNRWGLICSGSLEPTPKDLVNVPIGKVHRTSEALLIDMRATDAVLRKSFDTWLKNVRGNQIRRKEPAYKHWARYGLLPYLDLKIWEVETGHHIPGRVMSEAISKKDDDDGSSLRKTVIPLAGGLMHDLSDLIALAASEDAPTSHTESSDD